MNLLKIMKTALGQQEVSSKEDAKKRLRILLVEDRNDLNSENDNQPPAFLNDLKNDLMKVLKNYFPTMEDDHLAVNYLNTDRSHLIEVSVSLESGSESQKNEKDIKK